MITEPTRTILDYLPEYRSSIRDILTKIGWAEQYVSAMEAAAEAFSKDKENYGVYLAVKSPEAATFWNTIRGRGADASKPVEQDKANELLHSGKLYQAGKTPGQVR